MMDVSYEFWPLGKNIPVINAEKPEVNEGLLELLCECFLS